jgi:hypothetical protein
MVIKKYTEKEWRAEGVRLFGEDIKNWKFICPSCGNIQTINDFKKYKNKGAIPSDVYFNCIGRFSGDGGHIGGNGGTVKPCNYTTGGFFNLSPVEIKDGGGKINAAFDFYREEG